MDKIAPSMLSCDFSRFGEELIRMEKAGADLIHLDVMDGCFVPNITFGAPIIKSLRPLSGITFDAHLMIIEPLRYIEDFALAGADIITFNIEARSPVSQTINTIKQAGRKASLCVKPGTPVELLFEHLDLLDMVLIMTVEPGFGGQSFIPETLTKIRLLREECTRRGLDLDIQVDGGISRQTVGSAARAGANVFVAGSAIFNAPQAADAIDELRLIAQREMRQNPEESI